MPGIEFVLTVTCRVCHNRSHGVSAVAGFSPLSTAVTAFSRYFSSTLAAFMWSSSTSHVDHLAVLVEDEEFRRVGRAAPGQSFGWDRAGQGKLKPAFLARSFICGICSSSPLLTLMAATATLSSCFLVKSMMRFS